MDSIYVGMNDSGNNSDKLSEEKDFQKIKLVFDFKKGRVETSLASNKVEGTVTPFEGISSRGNVLLDRATYAKILLRYGNTHHETKLQKLMRRIKKNIPTLEYEALRDFEYKYPHNSKSKEYMEIKLRDSKRMPGETKKEFKQRMNTETRELLNEKGIEIQYNLNGIFSNNNIGFFKKAQLLYTAFKSRNYADITWKAKEVEKDNYKRTYLDVVDSQREQEHLEIKNNIERQFSLEKKTPELSKSSATSKKITEEKQAQMDEKIQLAMNKIIADETQNSLEEFTTQTSTKEAIKVKNDASNNIEDILKLIDENERIENEYSEIVKQRKENRKNQSNQVKKNNANKIIRQSRSFKKEKKFISMKPILKQLRELSKRPTHVQELKKRLAQVAFIGMAGVSLYAGASNVKIDNSNTVNENVAKTSNLNEKQQAINNLGVLANTFDNKNEIIDEASKNDILSNLGITFEDENSAEINDNFTPIYTYSQLQKSIENDKVIEDSKTQNKDAKKQDNEATMINEADLATEAEMVNLNDALIENLDIGVNSEFSMASGCFYSQPEGKGSTGHYKNINGKMQIDAIEVINSNGEYTKYNLKDGKTIADIKAENPDAQITYLVGSEGGMNLGWNPATENDIESALVNDALMKIKPYLSTETMQFLCNTDRTSSIDLNKYAKHMENIKNAMKEYGQNLVKDNEVER